MKQLLEDLHALDTLFDRPEKWTKGGYAFRTDGRPVRYDDPTATCYCLLGGIYHVTEYIERSSEDRANELLDAMRPVIVREYGMHVIACFNDHEEIAFDDIKSVIAETRRCYER